MTRIRPGVTPAFPLHFIITLESVILTSHEEECNKNGGRVGLLSPGDFSKPQFNLTQFQNGHPQPQRFRMYEQHLTFHRSSISSRSSIQQAVKAVQRHINVATRCFRSSKLLRRYKSATQQVQRERPYCSDFGRHAGR